MKPVFITAKNLDDCYFQLLSACWNQGRKYKIDAGSFAGNYRLELDCAFGVIEFPSTRPLAPIFPPHIASVATDEDIEQYFATYIMDSNLSPNEDYRYSTWISGGEYNLPFANITTSAIINKDINIVGPLKIQCLNQLEWIINHYKSSGYGNNHCYIQIGYPESNIAYDQEYDNETLKKSSPCFRGLDTKIINENGEYKLLLHTYFRSWDLYSGWPVNMGGITLLGEYICSSLGDVSMGALTFSSLKLHCYDYQLEQLKSRLGIE